MDTSASAKADNNDGTASSPNRSVGFFDWVRGFGITRSDGWIGGVCAGVAHRLNVDPILIRGIVVVAAVLSSPAIFLYAIAWLLLPTPSGEIHLQRLLRGQFEPAVVGIGVLLLASLLPTTQFFWESVLPFNFGSVFTFGLTSVVWLVLVGGIIAALVSWLITRSRSQDHAAPPAAGGTTPITESVPASPVGTQPAPAEPQEPDAATDSEEYAAWRAGHEAWQVEYAAWRNTQADTEREAKRQLDAQNKAAAEELVTNAVAARRARQLAQPRAGAAFVFTVLGAALLVGAIAASAVFGTDQAAAFSTIGFATAAVVAAAGMAIAALLRRRSGALALVTAVFTVAALTAVPINLGLTGGKQDALVTDSAHFVQPFGTLTLTLSPPFRDSARANVVVSQISGTVNIAVPSGMNLELITNVDGGMVTTQSLQPAGIDSRNPSGGDALVCTVQRRVDPTVGPGRFIYQTDSAATPVTASIEVNANTSAINIVTVPVGVSSAVALARCGNS